MTNPLNRAFNVAVRQISARYFPLGFDVSDNAPSSLEALTKHVNATGRMLVWSGASDRTIFACPETNHAFRAWHDLHHYRLQAPFNELGELQVCRAQKADLWALYGDTTPYWEFSAIVFAEVIGQLRHEQKWGVFPADQMAFTRSWLAVGSYLTLMRQW